MLSPPPLWRRLAAIIYDSFLIAAISMAYGALVLLVFTLFTGTQNPDYQPVLSGPLFSLGWLITIGAFYVFFWVKAGQTAGMKAWQLSVVTTKGEPVPLATAIIRFCASFISFIGFGLGYSFCLFTQEKQSFHDLISQTRTYYSPKKAK